MTGNIFDARQEERKTGKAIEENLAPAEFNQHTENVGRGRPPLHTPQRCAHSATNQKGGTAILEPRAKGVGKREIGHVAAVVAGEDPPPALSLSGTRNLERSSSRG